MKTAKRVLVCLILVAAMVTAVFVSTSANATDDYADILKYYDPEFSTILLDDEFDDGEIDGTTVVGANDTIANRFTVAGEDDKYMNITMGTVNNPASIGEMFYMYEFETAEDMFIFNFEINATHAVKSVVKCACGYYAELDSHDAPETCPDCNEATKVVKSKAPVITLYLDDHAYVTASITGVPFVTLDYEAGKVYVFSASTYIPLDMTLSEDKWYKFELVFEKTEFALTVTDVAAEKAVTLAEVGPSSVFDVKSVRLGALVAVDNRESVIKIDDAYLQKGDSYRKVDAAGLFDVTAKALANMKALLADEYIDRATKVDIIRVYDELVLKYNLFDVVGEDEAANASIKAIQDSVLRVYADMLKEGTDAIEVRNNYETRLALINDYAYYATRVAEYIAEDSPEDIKAVYQAYVDEAKILANYQVASEKLIALVAELEVTYDFYSDDYSVLKVVYDAIRAELYVDGAYTYIGSYPGITDALNKFNVAKDKYEAAVVKSEAFVKYVSDIAVAETDADRLSAYAGATANYFDNVSYPGVEDALAEFNTYTDLKAIGEVAEKFLALISQAEAALNLTSKTTLLDEAEEMLETVNENYPGVTAAKAQYNEIRKDIADSKANAEAYINAVNGLKNLTGEALRAAIQNCLALKEKGNVLEIEGVAQANIALDNAKSAFDVMDAYAVRFDSDVAAIAKATTLTERFAAIKAAKESETYVDDSVAGVSANKLALANAVSAYETDANAINESVDNMTGYAVTLSTATVSASDIMLKVVSFVKALLA